MECCVPLLFCYRTAAIIRTRATSKALATYEAYVARLLFLLTVRLKRSSFGALAVSLSHPFRTTLCTRSGVAVAIQGRARPEFVEGLSVCNALITIVVSE